MAFEDHELAPATLLRGHVSEETAYVVDDYPFGFKLRCKIRYWLHTAERGSARGQVRFVSQTSNPKVSGLVWNKPKPSTYRPWGVMYADARGHVHWWTCSQWGPNPWEHLRFRLCTLYDQLNEDERDRYAALVRLGVSASPESWERAKRAYALVGDDVTRDELSKEHGVFVDDGDYQVAVAARAAGLTF